jgi:hypothetical protein
VEKETYIASIAHAMALAGGCDALANRLDVTVDELLAWTRGTRTPDTVTLLRVLDVVMVETRNLSRAAMARGLAEVTLTRIAAKARADFPER